MNRRLSGCANNGVAAADSTGMTAFRRAAVLAAALAAPWLWVATAHAEGYAQLGEVPVVASPTCGGNVSAEAQVIPVQTCLLYTSPSPRDRS